jgi:hypothetical protein
MEKIPRISLKLHVKLCLYILVNLRAHKKLHSNSVNGHRARTKRFVEETVKNDSVLTWLAAEG